MPLVNSVATLHHRCTHNAENYNKTDSLERQAFFNLKVNNNESTLL